MNSMNEKECNEQITQMIEKSTIVTALELKSKTDEACETTKEPKGLGSVTRGKRRQRCLPGNKMSKSEGEDRNNGAKKSGNAVDGDRREGLRTNTAPVVKAAAVRHKKRGKKDNDSVSDDSNVNDEMEVASESLDSKKTKLDASVTRRSKRKITPPKRRATKLDEDYLPDEDILSEEELSADGVNCEEEETDISNNSVRIPLDNNKNLDGTELSDSDEKRDNVSSRRKGRKDRNVFGCVEQYIIVSKDVCSKSVTCDCCNTAFPSREVLKEHLQEKFDIKSKNIKLNKICECAVDGCCKRFSNTSNCRRHMLGCHVGDRLYTCEFCAFNFKRYNSLVAHVKTLHSGDGNFNYECKICHKLFRRKRGLEEHSSIHSDEKNFICPVEDCGKSFRLQTTLQKHQQCVHSKVRPYECAQCGERFSRQTYLDSHMYKHTGIKDFTCDICFKSFTQKGNMLQHKKSLHGKRKKSFQCPKCSQTFNFKSNLTKHLSKHDVHDRVEDMVKGNNSNLESDDFDGETINDVMTDVTMVTKHQRKRLTGEHSTNTEVRLHVVDKSSGPPQVKKIYKPIYLSYSKSNNLLAVNPLKKMKKTVVKREVATLGPSVVSSLIQATIDEIDTPSTNTDNSVRTQSVNVSTNAGNVQNVQVQYITSHVPTGSHNSTGMFVPCSLPGNTTTIDNTDLDLTRAKQQIVKNLNPNAIVAVTESVNIQAVNAVESEEVVTYVPTQSDVPQHEVQVSVVTDIVTGQPGNEDDNEEIVTYMTTQPGVYQHGAQDSVVSMVTGQPSGVVDSTIHGVNVQTDSSIPDDTEQVYVTESGVMDALQVILGTGEQQITSANIINKPASTILGETYTVSSSFNTGSIIQSGMSLSAGMDGPIVSIIDFTSQPIAESDKQ